MSEHPRETENDERHEDPRHVVGDNNDPVRRFLLTELQRIGPDVVAAAHAHSPYGKSFSSLGIPLAPLTQDSCVFYGDHTVIAEQGGAVVFEAEAGREEAAAALLERLLALNPQDNHGARAELMNHYGKVLGMQSTNFRNSTGLPDPDHYTTARDIAVLSAATVRDFPNFYTWYSEKEFTFNNIRQHNRNTLLWRDPAIDGLKTGHTEAAGYCLAASAKRDGMRLVSAVMGAASEATRASQSQTLLNYGFRFFETVQLYQGGQELARARVWKGLAEDVALGIGEELFVTIPRGRYDDLEARVEVLPQLTAPLAAGDTVGSISVVLGDETVASRDLLTLGAVEEAGLFGSMVDTMTLWFDGLFEDDEEEQRQPEAE